MSYRPWLSVCIPVYNVLPYLEACVASVLADGVDGIEVLLLEDCSSDGSDRLAAQLAERHAPQVRLLRHERNGGLSAARNSLIEASVGDYLWFLDSDDLLLPGAVASLRDCVQRHAPDLVLCDFRTVRENFRLKHRLRGELHRRTFAGPARTPLLDPGAVLSGVFENGHLHSWSKIAHRSVWGQDLRFPVGRYFEDMATTPALILRATRTIYMDEVWVGYRQRAGSILASGSATKIDHMMQALVNVPALLQAQQPAVSDDTRFRAAYFAAKTFITACRFDGARGEPQRLSRHLDLLQASSPLAPKDLLRRMRDRHWHWRAARLNYWLRACRSAIKAS